MADAIITKAELARELDLSRARVTQLCQKGLPVRPDGKLNRAEALEWIRMYHSPWRGGWAVRKKNQTRRAPIPAASMVGAVDFELSEIELGDLADIEIPDWEGEIRESAVIEFMNEVRQTGNLENFARMALRFGCTMQQAYAVARWFDLFMVFYFTAKDQERDYVRVHAEPDWNGMAAESGCSADVEAWQEWMNRILEEGEAGKVEA